jgi:hypothetical protein
MDTTEFIEVIDSRGRKLTPCKRKVADREVRLGRAKWIGRSRIRLRFDPFAYRYIRLKVLARDKYTCYWCGQPGFTMDHVVPWSKGGRTTMTNCICACEECNGQRGDTPADEFARRMNRPVPLPGLIQSGRHIVLGATVPAEEPAAVAEPKAVEVVEVAAAAEALPQGRRYLTALLEAEPVMRRNLY